MASAAVLAVVVAGCATSTPQTGPSFFVTSEGGGKGADFGGLAGADKHCQTLAAAVGLGDRTWRAYLSTQASGSTPAVNARDRIGTGPWRNVKGVVIATNVDELHANNNLTKQTALTEKGAVVNGRGDTPNQHDVLTGTQPNGTAFTGHRRQDLRQLDQERRRLGHRWPHRPAGPAHGPDRRSDVVELVARVGGLQRSVRW